MGPSLFKSGLPFDDELQHVPSPKPTSSDKARFGTLASLYTSFSVEFGEAALDICLRAGARKIADPFGGMGTLAEAARSRSIELTLSDLSPFSVLSCSYRAAPRELIEVGSKNLEEVIAEVVGRDETEVYADLLRRLSNRNNVTMRSLIENPSNTSSQAAAIALYLASVSRIRLHRPLVGSNPTWVKRSGQPASASAVKEAMNSTIAASRNFSRSLSNLNSSNRTSAIWSGIENLSIAENSLDAIVTSPPYANRTDYIRHYLPASELLLSALGADERSIRAKQIGTPLIRLIEPNGTYPKSVVDVLNRIRAHPSKASASYYYKGFLYYFSDMTAALERMGRWIRKDGILMMVVQDSAYKEIHVPTTDLLIDIAASLGLRLVGRRGWRVQRRLSKLSLHTQNGRVSRISESVIILSK